MANPILSKLMSGGAQSVLPQLNNLGMIKNYINLLKGQGNMEQAVEGLVKNHPMYQQAMKFVQDNGGNYQQAFYAYAQQNGIDPKEIENLFK